MDRTGRAGPAAGALAPVVLLVTVLGGALATPGYQWPTDPFSVVGGTGGVVALAFDAGLLLSGGLAVLFAVSLWRPALGVLYAVGGVGLAGAGAFPVGSGLHGVAALFFTTCWLPYDVGAAWAMVGYGAAELVAFLAWGAWSAWTASRLADHSTTDGSRWGTPA